MIVQPSSVASVYEHNFQMVVSQMEYFQDDIYPETRVWWESALTCQEWLAGQDKMQPSLSLRPPDMKTCKLSIPTHLACLSIPLYLPVYLSVSEAPKTAPAPKKYQSYNSNYKTDEEKKEEVYIILAASSAR